MSANMVQDQLCVFFSFMKKSQVIWKLIKSLLLKCNCKHNLHL